MLLSTHALLVLVFLGPAAEATADGAKAEEHASEAEPDARKVVVTTDGLGEGTEVDAYRHAGARTVVGEEDLRAHGATTMTQAFERVPGVRAVQGAAGLGSVGTKLNVAVRGVSPRFSSRSTVLLDEVPVATTPYGRPQLDLFPIGPFSIVGIDAAKSGASVRYGPQTSGGVFNLVSRPIPKQHTVYSFTQADQFGGLGQGAGYGGTFKRVVGAYVEYSARLGQEFREHSRYENHGGLVKLQYKPSARLSLVATAHSYWEQQQIPGGLRPEAYAVDPRSSIRTQDSFGGWRSGGSAKLRAQPRREHEFLLIAYGHHTDRASRIANGIDGEADELQTQPRVFDVVGVEPRYTMRLRHRGGAFHDLSFGLRGVYERADMRGYVYPLAEEMAAGALDAHDAAQIGAGAAFVEEKVYLADASVVLTVGVRGELVSVDRRDLIAVAQRRATYSAALPAASIWWEAVSHLALFASYGRSFGPPQFLQLAVATSETELQPEVADTLDGGVKLDGLSGFYGEVVGWTQLFHDFIDVSLADVTVPGDTQAFGVGSSLEWRPGDLWEVVDGLALELGHEYTSTEIIGGAFAGNALPWYPRHEMRSEASYWGPSGFFLGTDVRYLGEYFTDFANTIRPDPEGQFGIVPAATIWSAHIGGLIALSGRSSMTLSFGVRNIIDVQWIARTDDRNAGILPQQPRTFWASLQIQHEFARRPPDDRRRSRGTAMRLSRMRGDPTPDSPP